MWKELLFLANNLFLALLIANACLSWFPNLRWRPIGRLIYGATEPWLQPLRRLMPPVRISDSVRLDLSGFVLVVVVEIVYVVLIKHL